MLWNVSNFSKEHVLANPLLHQLGDVRGGVARRGVLIVEDAEAEQHSAQAMTQPLTLVMLIGANLVEKEAQRVLALEEDGGGRGAEVDPGAEELQEAALGGDVGGGCVLEQADTLTQQGHRLSAHCGAQLNPEQVLPVILL